MCASRVQAIYESMYGTPDGIPATFEVGFDACAGVVCALPGADPWDICPVGGVHDRVEGAFITATANGKARALLLKPANTWLCVI